MSTSRTNQQTIPVAVRTLGGRKWSTGSEETYVRLRTPSTAASGQPERRRRCLIGWEERSQLHPQTPDSRQRSPHAKRTEVEARRRQQKGTPSRTTSQYSESEDSEGGHWKSSPRGTRMPSHVKTYDGSEDPEGSL
ncbi:hypothetical protein Tco_1292416 [Tanacetum coccineum]